MNYKDNPPTEEEIKKWCENKLVNPRTGRKILQNGPTYRLLEKSFKKDPANKDICGIKLNVSNFKCLENLDQSILEEILNTVDNIFIELPKVQNEKKKVSKKKFTHKSLLDKVFDEQEKKYVPKFNIKPKPFGLKKSSENVFNDYDYDSGSDTEFDCDTKDNYKDFREHQVDPFTYEKVNNKTAFVFPWKWNPYSGERTDELDENGPLYLDADNLIHFFYSNRLNNLWISQSNDDTGYYHGHYGDAVGSAPEFEIKGRGQHLEWYLFRLPIIDCYLDEEHNEQYITMGPRLTEDEIKMIYELAGKRKLNYKKRHNRHRPNIVQMKELYEVAIHKEPYLGFEKELEQHLDDDDLVARRCKMNRDFVDKLVKF